MNVDSISMKAYEKWDLRVTTGRLNRWMKAMARHHPPPTVKGKAINVKYVTQVKSRPPTFALFVNKPSDVPESYQRCVFVAFFCCCSSYRSIKSVATQINSLTVCFSVCLNVLEPVRRFLLTQLREEFDMVGVPARLLLRGNSEANPFEKRKKFQKRTSSVAHGKKRKQQNPSVKK